MPSSGQIHCCRASLSAALFMSSGLKVWGWMRGDGALLWWSWVAVVYESSVAFLLLCRFWVWGAWLASLFSIVALSVLGALRLLGINLSRCGCFGGMRVSDLWHVVVLWGVLAVGVGLLHVSRRVERIPVAPTSS